MQGPNPVLEKEFVAQGALAQYTIGKVGAAEDQIVPAAAAGDDGIGVIQHAAADTERVRLMLIGISKVIFGAAVTQGERLISDANGKAIPTVAATDKIIGVAMSSGVLNDVGTMLVVPSGRAL